jgi:hypothetical protein
MSTNYPGLPKKEKERAKRRDKKRRPKMRVSGRSVLTLAEIIKKRAEEEKKPAPKSKKRS